MVTRKEYKKLHAEWYELASAYNNTPELNFWTQGIRAAGEPALELGSGTGRVLLPLLERGLDVWGIDNSPNMMARCRAAAARKGLSPKLYEQSMTSFELPQQFGLILGASGCLSLFVDDGDVHSTLGRVMHHLRPGGLFICEMEHAPTDPPAPSSDSFGGDWFAGPDGTIISWRRKHKYDGSSRTWKQLFIVEKFVDGRLVETEANDRVGRRFTVQEAVAFAQAAGFDDIRVTAWLTDRPPESSDNVATIQCRKPTTG